MLRLLEPWHVDLPIAVGRVDTWIFADRSQVKRAMVRSTRGGFELVGIERQRHTQFLVTGHAYHASQ